MKKQKFLRRASCVAVLAAFYFPIAHADERGDMEQLKATTLELIDTLVESGVLTRDKADKLIANAEAKAKARVAATPVDASGSPDISKDGKRIVRVPYIPEATKREMREQIKQEVLAQAAEERWGTPNALPEWLSRFSFEGDVLLRYDGFTLGQANSAPGLANYLSGTGLTRAPDFVGAGGNLSGVPNGNTQQDFSRERLRLRFGANVKVSDTVAAGFRVATGNITGPTSTNQTLGQGQNKYTLVLDRGFVTVKPGFDWSLTGGRIANPFMSTDLVWADDLNFEGVAVSYTPQISSEATAFFTAGWFPLRTDNPLQTTSRDLRGFQGGVKWKIAPATDFNFAAALYQYHGIEGQLESNASYGPPSSSDYGVRYEYPSTMRQRGNTLFVDNALADPLTGTTYWGLASGFNELNLTGTLDLGRFDPFHVVLTGDYVKNLDFSRSKMAARTGSTITDGKDYGYLGKLMIGDQAMTRWGDWNVSLAYRWLGSDAVLDAFTNSDFGMGGTNNKGYIMGVNWGIDKNAWVSAKWMASELIDSAAPKVAGSTAAPTQFKVDLFQLDLNAKF